MNGISARWCWRCDAGLSADGPALPRTVPSVVFDPPLADDPDRAALAPPTPPMDDAPWEPPPILLADPFAPSHLPSHPRAQPHLPASAGTSVARALTEHPPHSDLFRALPPPVLTQALGSADAPASAAGPIDVPLDLQREPPWPFEPPQPRGRRIAGLLALGVVVAAGVVGYVQWHDRGLPDLDRLAPTAAGPAAAQPPAPVVPAAPPATEPVTPAADIAVARPEVAPPREPVAAPSAAECAAHVAALGLCDSTSRP